MPIKRCNKCNSTLYDKDCIVCKVIKRRQFTTVPQIESIVYSGEKFNDLFKNIKFCKILRDDQTHFGFKYNEGLNIDTKKFNPKSSCEIGGLYFSTLDDVYIYSLWGPKIADVIIPNDANVYIEYKKFKADKIILSNIRYWYNDHDFCLKSVCENGEAFKYIPIQNQTKKLCDSVITKYHLLFPLVNSYLQTEKMCLIAISEFGSMFKYISPNIIDYNFCIKAMKINPNVFEYIPNYIKTTNFCLALVKINGHFLQYIPISMRTYNICKEAVKSHGRALKYIPEVLRTYNICEEAIKQDGIALKYVHNTNKTEKLCKYALLQNKNSIKHIPKQIKTNYIKNLYQNVKYNYNKIKS